MINLKKTKAVVSDETEFKTGYCTSVGVEGVEFFITGTSKRNVIYLLRNKLGITNIKEVLIQEVAITLKTKLEES